MTGSLFITGATGYIGRRMLANLDPNHFSRITCLCRSETSASGKDGQHRSRTLVGNLVDTGSYESALDPHTTVVHLAARTGKASAREYEETNAHGTRSLVAACEARGVTRFLHVSTIATTFEDIRDYPYAATKRMAEEAVRASRLDWAVVRPTIVLGPGSAAMDGFRSLLRARMIVVPGSGTVRMQPVHVDDIANILARLAGGDAMGREVYEQGGAEVLTLEEFLALAHLALYGGGARTVRVPIATVRRLLRVFEAIAPGLTPVHPGQLSPFFNDSVARPNDLPAPSGPTRSVSDMLEEWAVAERAGASGGPG